MKVFFNYYTYNRPYEHENNWFIYKEENEPEEEGEGKSPWSGEEAHIKQKLYPIDICVVSLIPAAFSDQKGDIRATFNGDEYFLAISNHERTQELVSFKAYSWDKALELASIFRKLSFKAGSRVWKVKKF